MGSLNFVNYNFDDLVQQLSDQVKASATWKDTYRSGTGQMMIELYAYVGNLVLYYIERVAEEGYLETARNRSSVINLVRLLGYQPKRAVSATGVVTFTLAAPRAVNTFIPKYTRLTTSSGVPYVVSEDAVILAGATTANASIIQGTKVDKTVVSSGVINQEYNLAYTDIENTNVIVFVNGIEWTYKTSFVGGTSASQWYKIRAELNDTITILFGENLTAKAPSSGDTILIRYIRSAGVDGNVYTIGSVNNIQSPIYDALGATVTDITVSNGDVVLGGDAAESTEEIRYEAPRVFATAERLVTRADYVAILENYASIASANAWGENEEIAVGGIANYDMYNRVKISIVLQNWGVPGDTFKTALTDYLRTKALITVKYTFVDPEIIEVIPTLDIKVVKGNQLSVVQSAVETALEAQFTLGDTTMLGTPKYLADLMATVEGVAGVAYHHMYLDIYENMLVGAPGAYTLTTQLTPILPNSFKVYVNSVQVGVDNGSGTFTTLPGSTYTVAGTIVYSTGVVAITVASAPGISDIVSVRYQTDNNGDLALSFNQICQLNSLDITSISYNE